MSTMLASPPHTAAPLDLSALPPSALLTESEVAPALRASKATLANWRTSTRAGQPKGPAFIKLAGTAMVRYRVADVIAFIESEGVTP